MAHNLKQSLGIYFGKKGQFQNRGLTFYIIKQKKKMVN